MYTKRNSIIYHSKLKILFVKGVILILLILFIMEINQFQTVIFISDFIFNKKIKKKLRTEKDLLISVNFSQKYKQQ